MVLEKTLESPLDCKEIQPVHSNPWGLVAAAIVGAGVALAMYLKRQKETTKELTMQDLMLVMIDDANGKRIARGPIFTHYEFYDSDEVVDANGSRLNDIQWQAAYDGLT